MAELANEMSIPMVLVLTRKMVGYVTAKQYFPTQFPSMEQIQKEISVGMSSCSKYGTYRNEQHCHKAVL